MNQPLRPYSEQQARARIGQTYQTLIAWAGVPQGTIGKVVDIELMNPGELKKDPRAAEEWDLVIEWQLPQMKPSVRAVQVAGEQVIVVQKPRPLRDWFTRDDMRVMKRLGDRGRPKPGRAYRLTAPANLPSVARGDAWEDCEIMEGDPP